MCECSSRSKRLYYSKNFFKNKAVSDPDGAISFYFVSTRVSKFTYGSFIHIAYDLNNKSVSKRVHLCFPGSRRLRGSFSIILPNVSSLFPFFKSLRMLFCRIPKIPRRRNSEDLVTRKQILGLVYEFLLFLFGVIVETSWIQCGQTLIPMRVLFLLHPGSLE